MIGLHKGQTWHIELKISEGVVFPRLSQPPRCDNYTRGSDMEAHFHPGAYRLYQRVSSEGSYKHGRHTTLNNTWSYNKDITPLKYGPHSQNAFLSSTQSNDLTWTPTIETQSDSSSACFTLVLAQTSDPLTRCRHTPTLWL